MTSAAKKELIAQIVDLFLLIIDEQIAEAQTDSDKEEQKVEMLTVKECAEVFSGISEHTIRKMVKQRKIRSVRAGEGERGKILINKADLEAYLKG